MRNLRGTAIAMALLALSLIGATSATAAAEVGSNCTATTAGGNETIVPLAATTGSTLPIAAPSAGVVTKWKLSVAPFAGSTSQALKALRPTGVDKEFEVVAESPQNIVAGNNSFDVRIPVQAGDRFGIYGSSSEIKTLACAPSVGAAVGLAKSDSPVGSKQLFATEIKEAQVPIVAVVEPDADRDGYGDESQDKCPQSAAIQAVACPPLALDAVAGAVGKSAVRILVASSSESAITVSASAKIAGKTKKAKASAQAKLAPISQLVTPGRIATYTMNFTKALKDALAALPRSKSLKLEVTATGNSLAGATSSDKFTVKLKGQAKSH